MNRLAIFTLVMLASLTVGFTQTNSIYIVDEQDRLEFFQDDVLYEMIYKNRLVGVDTTSSSAVYIETEIGYSNLSIKVDWINTTDLVANNGNGYPTVSNATTLRDWILYAGGLDEKSGITSASNNLFTADLTLTADRDHDLADNDFVFRDANMIEMRSDSLIWNSSDSSYVMGSGDGEAIPSNLTTVTTQSYLLVDTTTGQMYRTSSAGGAATVTGVTDQTNGLDITLSSTLVEIAYDFTELSNIATVDDASDRLVLYDNSGAVHGYITPDQITGGGGSTDYISDVTTVEDSMVFVGTGSAFNDTVVVPDYWRIASFDETTASSTPDGAIIWVDPVHGDNTTGEIGNRAQPYQTLASAFSNADLISDMGTWNTGQVTVFFLGGENTGTVTPPDLSSGAVIVHLHALTPSAWSHSGGTVFNANTTGTTYRFTGMWETVERTDAGSLISGVGVEVKGAGRGITIFQGLPSSSSGLIDLPSDFYLQDMSVNVTGSTSGNAIRYNQPNIGDIINCEFSSEATASGSGILEILNGDIRVTNSRLEGDGYIVNGSNGSDVTYFINCQIKGTANGDEIMGGSNNFVMEDCCVVNEGTGAAICVDYVPIENGSLGYATSSFSNCQFGLPNATSGISIRAVAATAFDIYVQNCTSEFDVDFDDGAATATETGDGVTITSYTPDCFQD